MATLYINRSESSCGKCYRNADPHESSHEMETMWGEGCGATYTAVSSNYSGMPDLYERRIREMRPDLPFIHPASDWEAKK